MPIPGLSTKTSTTQNWRRHISASRRRHQASFNQRGYLSGPKKKWPKKIFKSLLILAGLGLSAFGLISIFLLGLVAKDLPNPNRIIDRSLALSTKIYDRTGETVLYDVHGAEKRSVVELSDIPEFVKQATLIAEDKKFYEHKGVRFTSIIRSVLVNLLRGSKAQGGSTLTQQLVKNAILSPEKTYSRKIKEIILAYQIEKKFSKDEILKMYFNEIPYGSTAYGIEAATQTYFGKSVKNINLAEATILAALPKAPTYYSPYGSHQDELFARQRYILEGLAEAGYITQEDAEKTAKEKVEFTKARENIIAPHFVMYVKEYLTQKFGDLAVEQGGLKVITTLDLYKQKIAEEVLTKQAEKNLQWNASNAALVSLDPKTGQILALVGSKDFFDEKIDGQVNVVIRPRQPGSSFKPIVYAAAFKKGYTPQTVLNDVVTNFINYDGKNYEPKNYDLKEHGPVTMAKALAGSLNIPAVKTIYLAGVDNVLALAEKLGYTTFADKSRFGLSLVLGGGEVKLLEHTNAFAVFAREGEYHPPAAILEVRDKDGNLLEEYKKTEKKVLETEIARQINQILSDNSLRAYIFGEQNYLTLGDRPVAAKTGTANDYHDAWTIGYTPSLVTGVWVGNSNNKEMKRGADGSVVAAPIWRDYMSQILGDTPLEAFKEPEPVTTDKPVLNGSLTEGLKVKVDKITGKLATNLTPESQTEERIYRQIHNILYYLNKDDPQGNASPDFSDPQYQRWEEAVQRWATENNIIAQDPPTEYDDIHTLANQPKIKIIYPATNQLISDPHFIARINASANRGVKRVEYYLNDQLLRSVANPPFDLEVILTDPQIKNGFYQLKAVAFDDVDNNGSDLLELNFNLP